MLTIGKVAALSNTTADTLRFYERERLVTSKKSANGYRQYAEDTVRRIQFIKHAQQCGFSLAEIREMLELRVRRSACCNDVRSLTVEKKLQVEHKIRALQAMSKALDRLITTCSRNKAPVDECPILQALDSAVAERAHGG